MAVTIKNLPDGRKIKVNSFGSRRSEPTSFVEATVHEETGQPIALSNVDNVKYYKQIIGGTEKVLQKSSIGQVIDLRRDTDIRPGMPGLTDAINALLARPYKGYIFPAGLLDGLLGIRIQDRAGFFIMSEESAEFRPENDITKYPLVYNPDTGQMEHRWKNIITLNNCQDFEIYGLGIDGNRNNLTGDGRRGFSLELCQNFKIHSIKGANTAGPLVDLFFCKHFDVDGIRGNDVGSGVQWWGGDAFTAQQGDTLGVEDGTITRVRVNGADLGGVWGSMGRDIEIDRCYLKDCLDVGIDAEFCEDITATNSTIIDAGNGGLAAFFGTKRFKTSKNTIRRKSLAAGAGLGYGFWITTSNGNKNEGIISEGDTFIHEDSTVIYADSNSMNSIKIIDPTIQTQSGGSMRITAGNGKVEWYGGSINHQAINRSMSLEGCTEAIIKPDLIKTVTDTGNGSSFGDAAILVYETSQGAPTRKNLIAPKRVEGFTVAVNDVATVLGVSQNTIEGVKTNGLIKWSGSVGNYRDNFRLDDPTLINQPVPVVPDAELQQDVKKYELLKRINQNQARINKKLLVNAAADYNGNPAFGAEIFGNIDLGYIRQMFLSIQGSGMDYVLGGSGGPGGDSLSTGDRFIRGFTLEHLFSRLGAAGYTFFQAGAADFNTIVSKMGSYTYTIDKGNAPNPNAPTSGTRHIGYQIVEATFCVQFARDYEDLAIEYSRKGIFANSAWSFTAWERTSGGAQTDPEPQSYTLAQLNTMRAAGELEYPSTYYLSDPEYTVNGQKSYVIALGPSSFGDAIVPLTLPAIRVQAIMRVIEVNAMARVSALNWKREDRYLFDGTQNPYLKVKANDQGNQTGGSTIE